MAEVEIKVKATDETGGVLGKLSTSADGATKSLDGTSKSASASSTALGTLKSSALALGATLVASYGVSEFVGSMTSFQSAMANVSTLVDTSKVDMAAYKDDIASLAVEVGRGTTDLADGLYQVISAGVESGSAMDVVAVAAKAATAGLTDTFTAVDVITTALNAYGLEASSAGEVSDILFTGVKLGKTTFEELAGSIGQVLPFSSQLDVGLGDVTAALAALTGGGLSTAESVTDLKALFATFIKDADKFEAAGIDITKVLAEDGLKGALDAIATATGGDTQKIQELVPEISALTAALSLTGGQAEAFATGQAAMASAAGETEAAFAKQSETVDFAMSQFKAAFDSLAAASSDTLLPALTVVITTAAEVLLFLKDFGTAIGEGAAIWVGWAESVVDTISGVVSYFEALPGKAYDWGASLVSNFVSGISSIAWSAVESIVDKISSMFDFSVSSSSSSSGGSVDVSGSYAEGTTYVPKTGVYVLHEGEAVVPASENFTSSSLSSRSSPGGTSNITFAPTIYIQGSGDSAADAKSIDKALADLWRYKRSDLRVAMEAS